MVGFGVMLNRVKLDGRTFYAKIRIWPCLSRITKLNRIIPSLFTKIHPWILNKISSDSISLIASTFLQQHCMEVVTENNSRKAK
jgi:hypothetical protein